MSACKIKISEQTFKACGYPVFRNSRVFRCGYTACVPAPLEHLKLFITQQFLIYPLSNSLCLVFGTYTLDIARSKVAKATEMARAENFPLTFEIEPE